MYFVLLHTGGGIKYARKIGKSLRKFGHNYYLSSVANSDYVWRHDELTPDNTIIHARAAHPTSISFVRTLEQKEREGFRVVNSVDTLKLTSDKLKCSLLFNELNLAHPKTIVGKKNNDSWRDQIEDKEYIIKPYISQGQGVFVQRFHGQPSNDIINSIPTNTLVIQEFVDVSAIYRVICLNGMPQNFVFVDKGKPNDWKFSVCLNKISMVFEPNANRELLNLARNAQKAVNGVINFIDIFLTKDGEYVISEINTACSLFIHERLSGINISLLIANTLHDIAKEIER